VNEAFDLPEGNFEIIDTRLEKNGMNISQKSFSRAYLRDSYFALDTG
jgi:hypothetical protein